MPAPADSLSRPAITPAPVDSLSRPAGKAPVKKEEKATPAATKKD
jgi:hypothetical protein